MWGGERHAGCDGTGGRIHLRTSVPQASTTILTGCMPANTSLPARVLLSRLPDCRVADMSCMAAIRCAPALPLLFFALALEQLN